MLKLDTKKLGQELERFKESLPPGRTFVPERDLGVSQAAIDAMLSGEYGDPEAVERLAAALGCDCLADEFVVGEYRLGRNAASEQAAVGEGDSAKSPGKKKASKQGGKKKASSKKKG